MIEIRIELANPVPCMTFSMSITIFSRLSRYDTNHHLNHLSLFVVYTFFRTKTRADYDYKCFLLTVKDQKERQERFFKSHKDDIPVEIIYGPDTRKVKIAREYEDQIDPEYFEKAIEMHYNSDVKRPDITYFNLGAIGCFVGHMEFYKRCFRQGLKYAVIFEDNVIIKSNDLYEQIQSVIDEKGDDFEMCFSIVYRDFPTLKKELSRR
jgi:hypothetical protein